jgi:hypothetical protein
LDHLLNLELRQLDEPSERTLSHGFTSSTGIISPTTDECKRLILFNRLFSYVVIS